MSPEEIADGLIPDSRARSVDERYYRDTGCYPAQHVLLLREKTWLKDKSIGDRLVYLFNQCEEYFAAGQRQYPYNTPWQIEEVERTELLMGRDFHIHGLEKSRHTVDEFCKCAYEDGMTKKRLTAEDYFREYLEG